MFLCLHTRCHCAGLSDINDMKVLMTLAVRVLTDPSCFPEGSGSNAVSGLESEG